MIEIKENCYKGTRILLGNEKPMLIDRMRVFLVDAGFTEIQIPVIQPQSVFAGKVGSENQHMMYRLKDAGDRDLCLAPEYTAIVQQLAKTRFKHDRDVKLFYVAECFRGEKPQEGRYRQFTQLGVEILNPERPLADTLCKLAEILITRISFTDFNGALTIDSNVSRGLDYYKDGKGFEITCDLLGSSKQICGGGEYDGGIGFAIGIDRLMLAMELIKQQQQLSTQ